MSKLNIFISSTCYDLSQVRADLFETIESLGHNPVLSEFPNFPIDPSKNTIENCIKNIKESADIFVLIIGNRYGYQLASGKSITNLEYFAARNKGIPIYVFISKQIINLLPVYIKNKDSDYTSIVDNVQIFEFANEVRSISGLWNFDFEKFQDIRNILKVQLSYLFKESLKLRDKLYGNPEFEFHSKLSGRALQIILNKDELYDYEFFAQVLVDEISKLEMLKKDYEYKIILTNQGNIQSDRDFVEWVSNRLAGTQTYLPNLTYLVNVLFAKYINEPGQPSDLKGLYYVSNTYSRIFKTFIDWTIETLGVTVQENQVELKNCLADILSNLVKTIWEFPHDFLENVNATKQRVLLGEKNIILKMEIVMEIDENVLNKFNKAFDDFSKAIRYRRGSIGIFWCEGIGL